MKHLRTPKHSLLPVFSFTVLLFAIASCGLKYTPQTPPETLQKTRQQVIESDLKEEFAAKGMAYKSVAFGETTTVKPVSFMQLDSLYELKYQLEQQGKSSKELERNIGIQRLIAQNDTTPILYNEAHVFSLTKGDTTQVISGSFSLNSQNKIVTADIEESIDLPKELIPYYTNYILGESFIYPGSRPEATETAFYDFYKPQADKLIGQERTDFILHTLELMQLARQKKTLDKQVFLKNLTRQAVLGDNKDYVDETFLKVEEIVNDKNVVQSYLVTYQLMRKTDEKTYEKHKYEVAFDLYLSHLWTNEIE
jgi:hypothetical protein